MILKESFVGSKSRQDGTLVNKPLDFLSIYRNALMGIATLIVVFNHLAIPINNMCFNFIKSQCSFGVDIFFLVSGIGLFFSLEKDCRLYNYYVKRFVRILPVYAAVQLVLALLDGIYNPFELIMRMSTLDHWFWGRSSYWFIYSILLCYIFFPIIHRVVKKFNSLMVVVLLTIAYCAYVVLVTDHSQCEGCRYFTFVLGVIIGKVIYMKENYPHKAINAIAMLSLLFCICWCINIFANYSGHTIDPNVSDAYSLGILWKPYYFGVVGVSLIFAGGGKIYLQDKYIEDTFDHIWQHEHRGIPYTYTIYCTSEKYNQRIFSKQTDSWWTSRYSVFLCSLLCASCQQKSDIGIA